MAEITVNAQSSIRIGGSKIVYFDPFKITDERHDADIIFITHEHFDHFSPEDIVKVANENSFLVAPFSMLEKAKTMDGRLITKFAFPEADSAGKTSSSVEGVEYSQVRAYNSGKPFHVKESGWLGYLVKLDGVTYFVTGDTDANPDNINVNCDVLFVPCGGKYTFDAKEAAEYAAKIKPSTAVPTHYGDVVGTPGDGKTFAEELKKLDPDIKVQILL